MTITIRDASDDDIRYVANNLREADRREACRITDSDDAVRAVVDSARLSRFTLVGLGSDQTPVAVAGVAGAGTDSYGIPWLVGTDGITRRPLQFLRKARGVLDLMFERSGHDTFYNVVDVENQVHQQWLVWIGAEIASEPVQVHGFDFFPFTIRRT